jgi:putative heme-binding domain-containing protein
MTLHRPHIAPLLLLSILLLHPLVVRAEDSLDPETERRSFTLPEGWEINLFASDPMVEKPIEMNWDNRGRLWVATSQTYPQVKPGAIPDDKIIILEDTKGVGRADKSTVFADGLFIPTAVAPGDGGAYVTNSTEIVHFDENPATGKAEHRRVVLSGFGTEDTHHIIHTLRWGFDGRLYWNQSIYIHSHVETPRGVVTLLGSGTWRFEPKTEELDVLSRGMVNPWGIVFDGWGRWFGTDGAGGEGIGYIFPGSAFQSAVGMDRILPGMTPHSPKYCSEGLLSGRHIPDDYQGDILTNDFRAHRIVRFKLKPDGSGFSAEQMPDFITTADKAFRPIDIRMGPDGAIYIADWYNPIIQHGEVDFRDPRRDHLHGRIWRVTAKGRPLVQRPVIAGAALPALLELLKSPEDYTRLHAKLELRERPSDDVAAATATWIKSLDPSDAGFEHELLEALWVYQTIDIPEPALLARVLAAKDARARAAAVRVAAYWAASLPNAQSIFAAAVADPAPAVRLEGICALVTLTNSDAITVAMRALDQPRDTFIDFALWSAANDLKPYWLPAFQSGKLAHWDKPDHLTFALESVKSPAAVAALLDQLKSNRLSAATRGDVIDTIAAIDPKGNVDPLFDLAAGNEIAGDDTRLQLISALEGIARDGNVSPKDPTRIESLFESQAEPVRAGALRLAGLWKVESLRPQLTKIALDKSGSAATRAGAFDGLASLGGQDSKALLDQMSEAPNDMAIRCDAIGSLVKLNLSDAAARAAKVIIGEGAGSDPAMLLGPFLQRDGGGDALAKALSKQTVPSAAARTDLQFLQSRSAGDSQLAGLLKKAAGAATGAIKLTPDEMQHTIVDVLTKGDPARGELIFRRRETGCYQCHAINGVGGFLAPDLGSIGASSPVDYVIDSILDPNKAIKDGYMGLAVVTRDGDVISGIKVRQDSTQMVLKDSTHEEIVVPLASVRRQKEIGSLMPTGLTDSLTHAEFLDLARFVSELGKPGPYAQSSVPVARRWRLLVPVPAAATADSAVLPPSIGAATNWSPAYTLLSGDLPMDAVRGSNAATVAIVQCQANATVGGKVNLMINGTEGLSGWIDQDAVKIGEVVPLELTSGVHSLTFRVNLQDRGDRPLRVELHGLETGGARVIFVGGK